MYATCLFCSGNLGRNESIEHFPVGRRLAFDAHRGRLWVVCRTCERWNLSPLDDRWEAIEEAERHYSNTRQRASTDNIGLARLRDGTELVRIGQALRPEFAAWRYGDQFGRRRRNNILLAVGGLSAVGLGVAAGAAAGISVAVFGGIFGNVITSAIHGSPEKVVAKFRAEDSARITVRRRHLAETMLVADTDAPLALDLRFKGGSRVFHGREAMRVAAMLVPHVNRFGGETETVRAAVTSLDDAGGVEGYLDRLRRDGAKATQVESKRKGHARKTKQKWTGAYSSGLYGLTPPDRLALEMALHEEAELRALQGELKELERAWRDAEEIAAISDRMFTTPEIESGIDRLRGRK